jgi:DNA-binding GntR family transcriptional regulator
MILPGASGDATRVPPLSAVVRQRILAGRYPPGTWIREVELQREFGLSNGPVREALQSAVADGLAERAPFRGVRVIDLSEAEIVELFEVRFALLGAAAELAAERASAEIIATTAALKARLREGSNDTTTPADALLCGELSRWVLDTAGNGRLREAYERTMLQSLLYVAVARKHDAGHDDVLLPFAFGVIDAIAERRPAEARRAVRALTDHTLQILRHDAAQESI